MTMRTTGHVAFGVPDIDEATRYYSEVFGFNETDRQNDWVELSSGALKVYLSPDDGHSPCFNLNVASVAEAEARLVQNGGSVYMRQGDEVFVQDKYGHCYCLSQGA